MNVRIEGPAPLSASVLWRSLRSFYELQGPQAFTSGVVPWRITSCPALAAAYAEASAAFARDCGGELQVVELGGGSGRLAFALMRALDERGVAFRYLFTDASASTVAAATRHPQLEPWIDQGRLSFQRLDALAPAGLQVAEGPVVLVANYLFDSLPHDAWRAEAGAPIAQHLELWSPEQGAPLAQTDWRFVDGAGAPEPALVGYAAQLGSGRFFWPTGPLACINAFAVHLRRPHLWLLADKGPGAAEQVRGQDTAVLARHGCVSALVNFDALRAWAGWRPWFFPSQIESRFGVYALVQGTRAVPELRGAWRDAVGANVPLRALDLMDHLSSTAATVPDLLQALAYSQFDPDSVFRISAALRERISGKTPPEQVEGLVTALDASWANHFFLDEPNDLAFEIATVLHRAGQLSAAAEYYRRSTLSCGPAAATFFNLALCLLDLGQRAPARDALLSTLNADPAHTRARALLASTV